MTEEGYKAAETSVAEYTFQASTLCGEAKTIHVTYGESWKGFKKLVETMLDIPAGLQKLVQGEHILQFEDSDCLMDLVEKSSLPEDKPITVMRISGTWFWVDADGENPSPSYSEHADTYKSLRYICEFLEDSHGEDTEIEEIGAGVICLPAGEVPQTSAALLEFLSGSEERDPVVPLDEEGDVLACPWNDIADMAVVNISEIWPPPRATKVYYGTVTPYPSAEEVLRALVCAKAEASEDEVKALASQCFFFACVPIDGGKVGALKGDGEMEMGSYFKEKYIPEPHIFVCANPAKQTIAFSYQTTFWY